MIGVRMKGLFIRVWAPPYKGKSRQLYLKALGNLGSPTKASSEQLTTAAVSGTAFYSLKGARTKNADPLPLCQGMLIKEVLSALLVHSIFAVVQKCVLEVRCANCTEGGKK